jgi:predicted ATPase/DNA-binding SARP family transcriptional activator/Tfp pilus assembly protein PilF
MQQLLDIRVLGPFEVLTGGRPADVGGSKRQALLAMLALRDGRPVEIDALVDGLWGDDLPTAPRNALHHHIARLRSALGERSIVGYPDGYAVEDASVDAVQFETLLKEARAALNAGDVHGAAAPVAAALALWRGPALQGLPTTDWFGAEARRLEMLRVDALEEQFDVRLALGEHRELTSGLRAALADNPFRERLWGQLMLALYRSGQQADALETFQQARHVLAGELGLEPGPELRRLQDAILAHDPAIAAVAVARRRRGNLPAPSTSFVGREEERGEVATQVREHRLVTLTGPPGVGKSRLAVETARALEDECPDGIWVVEFSRADGAADAVRLLANVVDVRGSDPLARVASRLRDARALLVLDACEHVLEEAARIVSAILAKCPGVRILATSREALHVAGEVRVPVAPLGVAAVDLFLERARAARPGFEADDEAVALAAEIARRVDGLPLAIELAAARTNVLGLAELVSILERRAAFLHDGPATDPSRTALRELVEWSYDLLHGDEKTLLQQLAVHRGGASLASLVGVAAVHGLNEATVTYLISALVDKSIVSAAFPRGAARYDMLDTVREYVLDRLAANGGLELARRAHAQYFATLADAARTGLRGPEWLEWMNRLELDHDNLWASLPYAVDAPDPLLAARLGVGLGWYFGTAERVSEGRAFIEAALEVAEEAPVPLRIELLAYACYFATEEGDLDAAVTAGERGLALAATAEAPWETAMVELALAFACDRAGPRERAVVLAEEARRTFDELGDRWGAGSSAVTGAVGALAGGDFTRAGALISEAVRLHEGYDVGAIPAALLEAWLAERQGDMEAAAAAYGRALEYSERAGFAEHAAFAVTGLGSIAFAKGDLGEAEALYRRALALVDPAPASWPVAHARARLAHVLEAVGEPDAAASLYREVIAWSEEPRRHDAREALFLALAGSPATAAELGLAKLGETALT